VRRLGSVVAVSLLALLAIPATPAAAADAPASVTVSMKQFAFMPASVTVVAGGSVTWTYDEQPTDVPPGCESPALQTVPGVGCPGHSATAADKKSDGSPLFDSGVHRADGFPYTVHFETPGTYLYYCIVHGGPNPNNPATAMNGQVVVTAAQGGGGNGGVGTTTTAPAQVRAATLPRTGGAPSLAPAALLALTLAFLFRRLCPR
jgi:plastocyanin